MRLLLPALLISLLSTIPVSTGVGAETPSDASPTAALGTDALHAAAAYRAVADGLRDHRPIVLWNALPAAEQRAVAGAVASCASRLPATQWSQVFDAIESLGTMLVLRSDLVRGSTIALNLLSMSTVDRTPEPWFRSGPLLVQLGRSPLGDVQQLAALDLAGSLEKEGRAVSLAMPDLSAATRGSLDELIATRDRFAASSATPLRQEEDRVLMRLQVPGQPAEDLWFVRGEEGSNSKWIPEKLRAGWAPRMNGLRERCAFLATSGKLAGWVDTLASSRDALAELATARTQAAFDAGMGAVVEAVGPQLAQMLLDSMLESTSIGGIQLNIGSMTYRGPTPRPQEPTAPAAEAEAAPN